MLIQNMLWYAETYSWQRADILLTVSSSFDVSIIAIQTGVWSSVEYFQGLWTATEWRLCDLY